MYYLTYYEAYPIYEPAEGGYYYEGRNCIEWANSESLTEVVDYISTMAEKLDLEIWRDNNDYDDIVDRLDWVDAKFTPKQAFQPKIKFK